MATERRHDDIISILRSEPEQTNMLLRIGIGAPIIIVFWHLFVSLIVPQLGVAPLTLLMIIAYGASMAYMAARYVHQADQWEIEAAHNAQRLMTTPARKTTSPIVHAMPEPSEDAPIPLVQAVAAMHEHELEEAAAEAERPASTKSFQQVYFRLRLNQELLHARRDGLNLSVVSLDVRAPHGSEDPDVLERIGVEVATLAAKQAKTMMLPVQVDGTEYMFALPEVGREAASAFVSTLVRSFGDYWCHFGLSVYPDDAHDADSLFEHARQQCEDSRHDSPRETKRRLSTLRKRA